MRLHSPRGMSLVEATIVLMVLSILTAVLAPSIQSYVDDAKRVKGKEDCEAIGTSITRVLKDTGSPFLLMDGTIGLADRFHMDNRADLVVSEGETPAVAAGVTDSETGSNVIASVSWTDPLGANMDSLNAQLVENAVGYTTATTFGLGWRGAYLSPIVGPDPWGFRYTVNSVYLGTGTDSTTVGQGHTGTGWSFDTMCVSAGPNAQIEIDFENTNGGTSFTGTGAFDDIVYVISGFGR